MDQKTLGMAVRLVGVGAKERRLPYGEILKIINIKFKSTRGNVLSSSVAYGKLFIPSI